MTRRALVILILMGLAWMGAQSPCTAGPWSELLRVAPKNVVVVGAAGSALYGFDAQTGIVLWRHDVESPNTAELATDGDSVFVTHVRDAKTAQALHRDPTLLVEALDPRSGATRWRYEASGTPTDGPLLVDGRLVIAIALAEEPQGRVLGLDPRSGQCTWNRDQATVAVAGKDKRLFIFSKAHQGGLTVTLVDPSTGTPLGTSRHLRGTLEGHPSQTNGALVVTTRTADGRHVTGLPTDDAHQVYDRDFYDVGYDHVDLQGSYLVGRSADGKILAVHEATTGKLLGAIRPPQVAPDKRQCTLPALDGDTLYTAVVTSPDQFTVFALDAATCKERAHVDVNGQLESPLFALPSGVWFGVGVKKADDSPGHVLMGLRGPTLGVKITFNLDNALGDSVPLEVTGPRGPVVLLQTAGELLGFDPTSLDTLLKVEADPATPLLVADKRLMFGDNNMNFVVFDLTNPSSPPVRVNTKSWFNTARIPNLMFVGVIVALLLFFIRHAKRDSNLFIRRLPGLSALDDAVGRATEMGKPVLYVCGTQDVDEMETLAGLSILGHVAKRAAEYETPLLMPTSRSVVMSTAQEVVREAHFKAGRPDSYQQDNIRYLTDDQFGYVAGVDGIMMRERPAANFYMGMFFGESLILAETGHATGAIQIAGTAQASQLPFFVAACDYTLMGEELFAASAYLSRDPREVGSLKGQDYVKALIMTVIVLASLAHPWWPQVKTWLSL